MPHGKIRTLRQRGFGLSDRGIFPSTITIAQRALNIANRNARKIKKQEVKNVVTNITMQPISGTPTTQSLSAVAQGNDFDERIGNKIKGISIQFKLAFVTNVAVSHNIVRVMLIVAKEGTLTLTNVLETVSISGFIDQDFVQDYSIIYDQNWTLNNRPYYDTSGTPAQKFVTEVKYMKKWKDLKNLALTFTGASSSAFKDNIVYLAIICDDGSAPTVTGSCRFRFIE